MSRLSGGLPYFLNLRNPTRFDVICGTAYSFKSYFFNKKTINTADDATLRYDLFPKPKKASS